MAAVLLWDAHRRRYFTQSVTFSGRQTSLEVAGIGKAVIEAMIRRSQPKQNSERDYGQEGRLRHRGLRYELFQQPGPRSRPPLRPQTSNGLKQGLQEHR